MEMPGIRGLAEIVIWVQDMDTSLAFYRDRLGLTVISPPNLPATFLRVGAEGAGVPQQIVLVPRPAASMASGSMADRVLHHIGLEVAPDQYDAERARLTAAGLEVRDGAHPFLPVEAFYVDDPDGNEVELVRRIG
jgi:catechol 2,3-dioxygenase-like lactoylglutathione lyase family enzyme